MERRMTEPDWALGWKVLERLKASLDPAQQPLLDAIADLLNKQDHSGFILLEHFFLQSDVLKFYTSLARRVYDYRDWIAEKVEPVGEHFKDVDKAYRDAFDAKYNQA
jgi:hypothetical protein